MSVGLAVGKFYPPHAGHHYMLDTMATECRRSYVAVCYSGVETIPVQDRLSWLRERHPTIRFFPVRDDSPVNYTDETWGLFLSALLFGGEFEGDEFEDQYEGGLVEVMRSHGLSDNLVLPTHIYSGEAYAPEFAKRLRETFDERLNLIGKAPEIDVRMMDRSEMPGVSATAIRSNPAQNWHLLAPATRAGLCKRVVVCGAESSGTSTLAQDLGRMFRTTVVPEYGRHFTWAVGLHHEWTKDDFAHIAAEQTRWENNLARLSERGLLICDTDDFATAMFSLAYLGEDSNELDLLQKAENHPADLYIITDHEGVAFEDDGWREHEDKRAWMTQWFRSNLPGPVLFATGSPSDRLAYVMANMGKYLTWDFAAPIEQRKDYEYDGIVQI